MATTANSFYVPGLMDLSKYRFEAAVPGQLWDSIVERSSQGTIFGISSYLEALERPLDLQICYKNNEAVGGLLVSKSHDGADAPEEPFLIHAGPMILPGPAKQNRAMQLSEEFRIISKCLDYLATEYSSFAFAASHSLQDLRPFQWHNFGTQGPKVDIALRYTSLLDISPPSDDALQNWEVYQGFNKSRRQEVRYGLKNGIEVKKDVQISDFLEMYKQTFLRQDKEVDKEEVKTIERVCRSLQAADRLHIYGAYSIEGELGSISIWATDSKRAYYLYGANDPSMRLQKCGTMVIYAALKDLSASGVTEVDFEGINSPKRGYFKLSFGGTIQSYPVINFESHH